MRLDRPCGRGHVPTIRARSVGSLRRRRRGKISHSVIDVLKIHSSTAPSIAWMLAIAASRTSGNCLSWTSRLRSVWDIGARDAWVGGRLVRPLRLCSVSVGERVPHERMLRWSSRRVH